MKTNPPPQTTVKGEVEKNKKIIPILISGFRFGDSYDEHFVANQIQELIDKEKAQAILQERSRIVEIIKGFETNGHTRLLSETGFWTSHDLLDKQKLLEALENNEI